MFGKKKKKRAMSAEVLTKIQFAFKKVARRSNDIIVTVLRQVTYTVNIYIVF